MYYVFFQQFIPKITIKKRCCSKHGILLAKRDFCFLKQFQLLVGSGDFFFFFSDKQFHVAKLLISNT